MKKKDPETLAGITRCQMCEPAKDKDAATDVMGAIHTALNVRSDEIMDSVPDAE